MRYENLKKHKKHTGHNIVYHIIKVMARIVIIIGILILCYPMISNEIYNRKVRGIVASFQRDINDNQPADDFSLEDTDIYTEEDTDVYTEEDIDIERDSSNAALDRLYKWMLRQNKYLYKNGQKDLIDPFSYEQPGIDLTKYGLSDNIVGYISIAKINCNLPIYLGASRENMKKGAVHLTQTSYPIGGNNTNAVIAAHRGAVNSFMFRDIEEITAGDLVVIQNFRQTLTYQVTGMKVIEPSDIEAILIQPDKDMITLITCHPYLVNDKRYVVYAERLE